MRPAVVLIVVASVGHLAAYLVAAPVDVADATWPLHARFHVLQALLWIAGLDAVIVALALGPLRRGERWSWWTLVSAGASAHAGYFASLAAIRGGGPPEMSAHLVLGALMAAYGAGLALGWRALVAR